MVLDYFGIRKTEKELAVLSGATKKQGVQDGEGLVKAARSLGLKAALKDKATLADIRKYIKQEIPVIVNWFSVNEGHYSVVVDIDKENLYIKDPEWGYTRAMRLDTFMEVWFSIRGNVPSSKEDFNIRRLIAVEPHKPRRGRAKKK